MCVCMCLQNLSGVWLNGVRAVQVVEIKDFRAGRFIA